MLESLDSRLGSWTLGLGRRPYYPFRKIVGRPGVMAGPHSLELLTTVNWLC